MKLDRTDRAIISTLVGNSRLSIRAVAELVHISRTAAHKRVQNLILTGVIERFATVINHRSIGLDARAIVIVRVGSTAWPEVANALAKLPYVESLLAVSGDIDFVLTVSAPGPEQLSEVIMRRIREIPGVASTRSHLILDAREGTPPGAARDDWHLEAL
jgi:DNA-binding Lrp family transcriptional regulator